MKNPDEFPSAEVVGFGQFTLMPAERLLKCEGSPIILGGRAMDILITLVGQAGTVVSKKELIARTWPDVTVDESGLRHHVFALRKALKDDRNGNRYITNVPGRGYSFVAPVVRGGKGESRHASTRADKTMLPHGLPPLLTRMVGRDEEVRDISARLTEHRFVTITGGAGMGKTTVAVSVAHELAATCEGVTWFIDFSEISDPDSVPGVLATALGITALTPDQLRSLGVFGGDKRVLLLLDNCEHLVGVVAKLAQQLFKGVPGIHILASSREALQADSEHVYRLQPLGGPPMVPSLSAVEAMAYPAVQLFIERAATNGIEVTLTDAEAPIVSEICGHLDGMPLAICVAAGRVGAHGLSGLAHLLSHPSCWLRWNGPRTVHSRHQTLDSLLDWSYDLLAENERLILRRLSVFATNFTLEGACAIAADTDITQEMIADVICSLVTKSLVSTAIDASTVTYRLLETTRAYARKKLMQTAESDTIVRRHADYLSRVLRGRCEDRVIVRGEPTRHATRPANLHAASR
ncbi:ATP-binding protein [Bradyrhizobium uaiense]|uniref:OmpR/PhoB-type domain-containing protein n=1 Tax=Bradyrhizobium uaiense TaxID=2594946 RepID=A0A6P1BAD2_9BRAD|nr:winged helix-turn-helix domain-containing protein [Bradyrhizobium uaiense]NEU95243.1 hypothetical protein [Bradyrhizobium uaiense]